MPNHPPGLGDEVREALRTLGQQRERNDKGREELTKAINSELARINRAGISKSEAARLLRVHRTTLYRVYNV